MKLFDNLYKIVGMGNNGFRVSLDTECPIYKAHFPERPITPGVCIIQIANELLNTLLDDKTELREVVNAKFLSVIDPLETKEVVYSFSKIIRDESCGSLKVSVTVASETTVCAKLSLLYDIDD